ncbi:MAG: ATP-binding cassette domain-containing protein [Lentisphaerae bacterium]|nr:ATP-binding cassette domain-containing protein [Lentisphaerota bacterium]
MRALIEFDNVTKVLAGQAVLDGVSFRVRRGEVFVIVGPSGAGKSVTLKHMVRLMTPDAGRVLVDGEDITELPEAGLRRVRERFGYLFQSGALLAWLNVAENVALPLREKTREDEAEIERRVAEALRLVDLEEHGGKLPAEISGGMRKRAGLARAIIRNPEIVLYDEPTSGLDPVSSRTIDRLIARAGRDLGVTSVVVTHDLHSALSIGTMVAMLYGGTIVEMASPREFMQSENEEVQAFLRSQFITAEGVWERNAR